MGVLTRVLGFYLLSSVISATILSALLGFSISDYNTLKEVPNGALYLLIAQGGGMIAGFIILPLLYVVFLKPALFTSLKVSSAKISVLSLVFSIGILTIGGPAINFLLGLNQSISLPDSMAQVFQQMEESAAAATALLVYQQDPLLLLLAILIVGIVPAVAEEFVFRGIMAAELTAEEWSPHKVIWITAIVFSAIHFQFYGFFPRMILGALLGYVAYWSNSLSAPMIFHAVNNISTLLWMNLYKFHQFGPDPENTQFPWYIVIGSIGITAALIYSYRKLLPSVVTNAGQTFE